MRVLYGRDALYVAARLYGNPDSIVAQLARRDASGIYSDWFTLLLDSDDDNRTAFAFGVNPREVKRDYVLSENGGRDFSWDAVWEARTHVDSLGWTAELRIPLSQLRFRPGAEAWGVNFQREVARREETSFWAPIPPDAPGFVSRFGALTGLSALTPPRRLEVEPYVVSRATRAPAEPENPFYSPNQLSSSAGADFRYGVSSSLTLTGTVNPDFGQVEADPAVVNLTAFETRFPERRPFFIEGAEIFEFELGGGGDLFYSRRIGAPPHGTVPRGAVFRDVPERTTILGAAKLSGKTANGWSVGLLDALTSGEEALYATPDGVTRRAPVEPLTNFGVARVIRDFRQGRSALGAILTTTHRRLEEGDRLGFLPSAAYAAGLDGRHRFGGGNYELMGYAVGSHLRGGTEAIRLVQLEPGHYFQRPDAGHLEVDPELTSLSGYIANVEVSKIGGGHWRGELGVRVISPGFEVDDLGFQQQADLLREYGGVQYVQFRPGPIFRRWSARAFQNVHWTFGGERVESFGVVGGDFQLHSYWGGSAAIEREFSALSTSALRGGPALRVPGRTRLRLGIYSDQRRPVSGSVSGTVALQDEAGGRFLGLGPSLALRPSPRVELSLQPSMSWNRDPAQYVTRREAEGETRYLFAPLEQTTTALTARLSYTFRPDLTLQFYAQPFISALDYSGFREVADPRAAAFRDRFRPASVDLDPDFNFKQFRSNAVLRWEYRPGSTLFVVWNSGLRDVRREGTFDLSRDLDRLFGAEGTNVLLVKLSYWFGL
ncbi:MAG TPA: DUF5916 domain-containing protein [Longimicrobiaceae bacterium]|nr:DUF5916 domain-containing protein [Longimicrobiaceae bacterium]